MEKHMQKKFLTRAESAAYLTARGLPTTKGTLQKKASTGGGPPYRLWGNKALSTPEELDEWAEAELSPKRRSASERDTADEAARRRQDETAA
jgi:hypothetical protein